MFHRASAKPPGFVCFVTDLVLASGTPMSAPSMYLGGVQCTELWRCMCSSRGVGVGGGGGGVGSEGVGRVRARIGSLYSLSKHLQKDLRMLGAVWMVWAVGDGGGGVGGEGAGGSGHALAAFKYSLNT